MFTEITMILLRGAVPGSVPHGDWTLEVFFWLQKA